jgi:hypothetical protein
MMRRTMRKPLKKLRLLRTRLRLKPLRQQQRLSLLSRLPLLLRLVDLVGLVVFWACKLSTPRDLTCAGDGSVTKWWLASGFGLGGKLVFE